MNHLGITWHEMSLQHLVEILSLAKDAAKHDVKAVRLQPMHILRGLRWLVKTALMDDVATLLNNALIASFAKGSTQPRDRKEAVPVPLWVLINWELHVIHPDTPDWTRLIARRISSGMLGIFEVRRFTTNSGYISKLGYRGTARNLSYDQDNTKWPTIRCGNFRICWRFSSKLMDLCLA